MEKRKTAIKRALVPIALAAGFAIMFITVKRDPAPTGIAYESAPGTVREDLVSQAPTITPSKDEIARMVSRWTWLEADSVPATVRNLRSMRGTLSAAETSEMLSFLEETNIPFSPEAFHWIADEILIVLRKCPDMTGTATFDVLSGIVRSHADNVVRDYALQHLVSYAEEKGGDATSEGFLQSVMAGTDIDLACQALIGLARLHREKLLHETDIRLLRDRATRLIKSTDEKHRIAALQIAAEIGGLDIRDISRSILENGKASVTEQVSAVAAIGRVISDDDRAYLANLGGNALDSRVRKAMETVVKKYEFKTTTENTD